MPFRNVSEYADYRSTGAWHQAAYLRTTAPASGVTGRWVDVSVGAGHPVYNAYAGTPLTAQALINNNSNRAVYTGPNPGPGETKHLHSLTVDTTTSSGGPPQTYVLCDYLLYYPFIDTDTTDIQTLDNTVTIPRYTTGEGVQCFVVIQAPTTATNFNGLCTVTYTNSDGVSGRTTTFAIIGSDRVGILVNAGNNSASVATQAQCSPFIPLAPGDKGIRSIQSVQMDSGIGGLVAFVLCYSVASIPLFNIFAQTEKTFFSRTGRAPKIEQGAFLHFIACAGSASVAIFRSSLTFVWG
jgi:hypothetical protein